LLYYLNLVPQYLRPIQKRTRGNDKVDQIIYVRAGHCTLDDPAGIDPHDMAALTHGATYVNIVTPQGKGKKTEPRAAQVWIWREQLQGGSNWKQCLTMNDVRHPDDNTLRLYLSDANVPGWVTPKTANRKKHRFRLITDDIKRRRGVGAQ
jgi:hypothetical protein